MIQKKNVLNTVPIICLGALLLGAAYGQLHTPMTPPPITALASDILPTTGNVRALVVVVDFADAKYIQTDACPMKKFPPICLAQTILNFIPVRA